MTATIARAWLALAALAAALATPVPAAAQQPDEAAFTRDVAERLRAALPGRPFTVAGPLEIRVEAEGYESMTVNVGRIWNFCATAPADECEASRAQFVESVAGAVAEAPGPVTRAQLRVAVRHADFCRELDRFARDAARSPVHRPGPAPGLCAVMMADYPTRMRTVAGEDLDALGLAADAAWPLAEGQTLAGLPAPDRLEGLDRSLVAVADMDYVPSLLLDAEGWRRAAAANGELIMAVPSDGFLIVGRRALVEDLAGMRRATQQGFDTAERGISPLVYRWTDAGWATVE
jgi:hypothetical protein